MTTLHDTLHASVDATEHALMAAPRPSLHRRIRGRRVARTAASSLIAVSGAGAFAVGGFLMADRTGPQPVNPAAAPAADELVFVDGDFVAAIPADTVVVDVYLDPMCPYCHMFATIVQPELDRMDGVTTVFHPISFLDPYSSDGDFSTRASSAILEVATNDPDSLTKFLDLLWENQPREGETLTDQELMRVAAEAGVDPAIVAVFPEHRYAADVAAQTEAAFAAGVNGTPWVTVDGQQVVFDEDGYLETIDVVEAALAAK